ncbi:GMC family oxidoreductase [Algoriphagus sp.]|uniref:GMC family oxidoreductase n=1 Tax=Algoriphagus sp. TaxID=1872435 RepID=UPI0025F5C845|nr:GMC family oxidoreductase [Algoriphagus sp.]
MEIKNYDVVIIGSGIAGSITANILTNAGKKVLLLEAGLNAGIALDAENAYKTYQGYLNTFYENSIKVPNSPYPNIEDAPSIDVLDLKQIEPGKPDTKGYLVQMGPIPFASDCLRGAGGTTLHWLGTTLRMLPNDFKMKKTYGIGVDWPFSYNDLKPYYEMAEHEIGVAGNKESMEKWVKGQLKVDNYYGSKYQFPMEEIPPSYMDKVLISEMEGKEIVLNGVSHKIETVTTPQGRNSTPNSKYSKAGIRWNPGSKKLEFIDADFRDKYEPVGSVWDPYSGQRCEGNASCVPICPVQAKYNALKTLKKADHGNLTIKTQAVASKLIINSISNWIEGVEYKTYQEGHNGKYDLQTAKGTIYVLAASAIENAKILLASGAANSSDQVGRNLMDHMTVLSWGLNKKERVYPFRGPGSTTNIATFRDGDFRKEHAAWISPLDNWGWGWPAFSPGSDVNDAVTQGMFGKELRSFLEDRITRQVLVHAECEQAPDPECRVTIDPAYLDQLGNYRPVIHYRATEYMLKAFEAGREFVTQLFDKAGIEDYTVYNPEKDADYVTYKGKGYSFEGAGHIVGTHRMGKTKEDSVVNENMRTWDHDNLFLVGCGNMPTLGTSNPTLTMAALTFKAAEAILNQLEN